MSDYDGIIIGTGHNGLIAQAYLAKAGFKTLSVDRLPVAGGGLRTEENPRHAGVFHNTHAFFQRAATDMPWYRDLELEKHGARYIQPELNVALLLKDGGSLQWWTDFPRTKESFARVSEKDARTLGLVNRVVAPDRVVNEAVELGRQIAMKPERTLKIGKEAFYRQLEMPLEDAYRYASEVMVENMLDAEAEEGIGAFIEKRKPDWPR